MASEAHRNPSCGDGAPPRVLNLRLPEGRGLPRLTNPLGQGIRGAFSVNADLDGFRFVWSKKLELQPNGVHIYLGMATAKITFESRGCAHDVGSI